MKLLLTIAWRNLGRNRWRTGISAAAVAFAVFCMVAMSALQQGAYGQMIDNSVKIQTGHLQVQAPGYLDDHDINLTVDHLDKVYEILDDTPGVVGAVGRIMTGMLVAHGEQSFGSMVLGTDAAREAKSSSLPNMVRYGKFLDEADPYGVILGDKLAMNLFPELFADIGDDADAKKAAFEQLLGEKMVILGQGVDGSTAAAKVTVRGVLHTGQPEMDRATLAMNLEPLQDRMMMMGRVSSVAVLLESYRLIPQVQAKLSAALADLKPEVIVVDWKEVSPGLAQGIAVDNASGKMLIFLLLLVVAFGILNTFLMSAFERFREFGVMMAIGVKPRTCAGTLLVESQMLMVVGFLVGLVLGGGLSLYLGAHGLHMTGMEDLYEQYGMQPTIYPLLTLGLVLKTFLQVWLVTTLVALYPARKITRFRPVEALRHT